MAITPTMVWEFRASGTGSMVNGGGFKPGASGTDYSQQDSAQFALTSIASSGAGAVFLTASAATTMVGNVAHIISGTNFTAGWYEIISVVAGVSVTLDRACCTGVGASGVINIGGALNLGSASLDPAFFAQLIAGQTVWIKSGSYALAANSTIADGNATSIITVSGYTSTRGDSTLGTSRPLVSTTNILTTGAYNRISNIRLEGSNGPYMKINSYTSVINCKVNNTNASGDGFYIQGDSVLVLNCEAISTSNHGIRSDDTRGRIVGCYVHDSTYGIYISSSGNVVLNNVVYNCANAAIQADTGPEAANFIFGNTLYGTAGKGGDGINIRTSIDGIIINNIITNFSVGVAADQANVVTYLDYNDFYNNSTDVSNVNKGSNDIAVNPLFNSVPSDFSLQSGSGCIGTGDKNLLF